MRMPGLYPGAPSVFLSCLTCLLSWSIWGLNKAHGALISIRGGHAELGALVCNEPVLKPPPVLLFCGSCASGLMLWLQVSSGPIGCECGPRESIKCRHGRSPVWLVLI